MKKIIIVSMLINFITVFSFGQADIQKSILTDKGIFTVSQTDAGEDMIIFNSIIWNQMVSGTKYMSGNLIHGFPVQIYIRISGKDSSQCRSGIGFSCGIFDRKRANTINPALVNKENRFAAAVLQEAGKNAVQIVFLDKVDWENLQ